MEAANDVRDVVYFWANGKKGRIGNVSSSNGMLYFFNTVIAQRIIVNGKVIFLINEEYYSKSLAALQSYIRQTIPDGSIKFYFDSKYFKRYDWLWGNFAGWINFNKTDQMRFVFSYLFKQFYNFKSFKTITYKEAKNTLNTNPFQEALRFIKIFKPCSLSSILRMTNKDLEKYEINEPKTFKEMIKALKSNVPIKKVVDIVCGDGTYAGYMKRVSGVVNTEYIKTLNKRLGFLSDRCHYYCPYEYDKIPKSIYYGLNFLEGKVTEGRLKIADIRKLRKSGELIKTFLEIKKRNFEYNQKQYENLLLIDRKEIAKCHLERYIGMRGWRLAQEKPVKNFNYNGTIIYFGYHNQEREIRWDEYHAYVNMSKEDRQNWIYNKKNWMLDNILRENEEHEKMLLQTEGTERLRKLEAEYYMKVSVEKKEYIASLEKQGSDGIRKLWGENLIKEIDYYATIDFFGGNVLLRVKDENIETSGGVKISIAEYKRLWKIISHWHENGKSVGEREEVNTTKYKWEIDGYSNDILIVGCHSIAYCEIKKIAEQLKLI
jgi:hypothetical protein